jgi:hypothetical protein
VTTAAQRAALCQELRRRYPWLDSHVVGPRSVEAGECDACGKEARMVMTCGPGAARYLGRRCAQEQGEDAWCAGHLDEARQALRVLARLPGEADTVARLWWVASGEVRVDPAVVGAGCRQLGLPW